MQAAHSTLAFLRKADATQANIVPPSGFTARLTTFAAGAMAFLAVFALALSLAAGNLAARWADELAGSATVRLIAPPEQRAQQTEAILQVLETTAGVASARALSREEQQALLSPWFGAGLDLSDLPVPQLIEIQQTSDGFDAIGLRLRLAAEAPGAVLDDHARWKQPLTQAAARLRLIGWVCIALIVASTAVIITLAAQAALAANAQVISVLRLIGATDNYIATAFVHRFTLRAITGSAFGTGFAVLGLLLLPSASSAAGILTGIGFSGLQWLLALLIPMLAGIVAYLATRASAARTLEGLT